MLKKILNTFSDNDKINKICLKLFKCQIKFLDKNWRIENNNIITNIYLFLDYGKKDHSAPIENFLTLEKRDKNFKEPNPNYFTLEELRQKKQETKQACQEKKDRHEEQEGIITFVAE